MEVKNHWIRILILISYFVVVFIVSRILDLVLWYHHGYLPTDLVDPLLLNVRQLKQLLDSRGVSYTGVLEKQQLVELLNDSAHVVKSEVEELSIFSNSSERLATNKPPPSSHFTGGSHFNEKVEDTKDSVWLVQVLPIGKRKEPLLDDYSWHLLKHQLAPFAIQTGVFDCALDRELCIRRNWLEPILLLALPRGNRPKDHIIIRTSKTPKIHMIVQWVKEQLSSRVTRITSLLQLEEDWLTPSTSDDTVRVVLLSNLLHTPLFFAALSIKFSGRIKFGMFSVKRNEDTSSSSSGVGSPGSLGLRKLLSRYPHLSPLPVYLVVTPQDQHRYGHWPAEHLNLLQMNLFLRLVVPEINDLFLMALLLTNMLAVVDICQIQGSTRWLYLIRTGFLVVGYNLILFALSLILYNLSWPPFPLSPFLSLLRALNFSYLGALIRSDLLSLYSCPLWFTGSFLLYAFLIGKRFPCPEASSEWNFFPVGDSFILNSLFRPNELPSLTFTSDVHFDLRFEQFVLSRSAPRVLNVPNLWLQTSPRVDYISDLPVFEYRGWRPCPHRSMQTLLRVMDGEMSPECLVSTGEKRAEGMSTSRNIQSDNSYEHSGGSISRREEIDTVSTDPGEVPLTRDMGDRASSSIGSSEGLGVHRRRNTGISSSESMSSGIFRGVISHNLIKESNVPCVFSRNNITSLSSSECINTTDNVSNEIPRRLSNVEDFERTPSTNSMSAAEDLSHHAASNEDDTEDTEGCDYLECRLIRSKDCSICLESYAPRTVLLALPCAHHFHKPCVLAWLQRGHPQCPVCRWPAYKQKYEFSY